MEALTRLESTEADRTQALQALYRLMAAADFWQARGLAETTAGLRPAVAYLCSSKPQAMPGNLGASYCSGPEF